MELNNLLHFTTEYTPNFNGKENKRIKKYVKLYAYASQAMPSQASSNNKNNIREKKPKRI